MNFSTPMIDLDWWMGWLTFRLFSRPQQSLLTTSSCKRSEKDISVSVMASIRAWSRNISAGPAVDLRFLMQFARSNWQSRFFLLMLIWRPFVSSCLDGGEHSGSSRMSFLFRKALLHENALCRIGLQESFVELERRFSLTHSLSVLKENWVNKNL